MVGVPRSNGCQLCRKRRVKCDEEKPQCTKCIKYGVECPGYEKSIKFVSVKHQIQSKGTRVARYSSVGSGSSRSHGVEPNDAPPTLSMVAQLSPNRAQYVGTMMDIAQASLGRNEVSGYLGFFHCLRVDTLGTTAALDGAVCSLAMHLIGKESSDDSLIAQSRTLYGRSLQSLQTALQHPTKWKSTETLCSSILLCVFELFAGTTSPDTWLQHAKGIGVLMAQRGPDAHAEGHDAAVIISFRGILIMSHLFHPTSDHSFLSRPEWKPIIRDRGRHLIHPPEVLNSTIEVMDDFFECLAELPEVLWWGYPIRQAHLSGMKVDQGRIADLSKRASKLHLRFEMWYQDFVKLQFMPHEVPSQDPTSPFAWVLEHKLPWIGSMFMAYWASMLILQELLLQCQWPHDFENSQKELVQNILRSVESVGKGPLGPYRLGYSLRIAYELASIDMQLWIRSLLDRFSKTYAATDKATYPDPKNDENGCLEDGSRVS